MTVAYYDNIAHQLQNANHAWSFAQTGEVYRFEVRAGDVWVNDQSYAERSEITDLAPKAFGRIWQVDYAFMIEPGDAPLSARVVCGQFHETPDGGDAAVSPAFAIEIQDDKLKVWARWTAAAVTIGAASETVVYLDAQPMARGVWHTMKLQVRFDSAGAGLISVTRDGVLLATYAGPLGSNDALGPYWKMGVYRASSSETIAVQYQGLRITDATPPGTVAAKRRRRGA